MTWFSYLVLLISKKSKNNLVIEMLFNVYTSTLKKICSCIFLTFLLPLKTNNDNISQQKLSQHGIVHESDCSVYVLRLLLLHHFLSVRHFVIGGLCKMDPY